MNINDLLKTNYIIEEKHNAFLEHNGTFLILSIEFKSKKSYDDFHKDHYDIINAKSFIGNKHYSFIECDNIGMSSYNKRIYLKYRVIMVTNYCIDNLDFKCFNSFSISFGDISWFVSDKASYEFLSDNNSMGINNFYKEYNLDFGKLIIFKNYTFKEKSNLFTMDNDILFKFDLNKSVSYNELIEIIYTFRNLLMIIGKRNINISSLYVEIDNRKYVFLDCFKEYNYSPINSIYENYLNHRVLTLCDINNFDKFINNFYREYKKLLPIIDSLFSNAKYSLPSKVRFINSATMVEDFANLYMTGEVNKETKIEDEKNKNAFVKKIFKVIEKVIVIEDENKGNICLGLKSILNDMQSSFVTKIKILIKKVNYTFNFDETQIEKISKQIRDARLACVHKGIFIDSKKTIYLNIYSSFIDDIIYLNILKILKININGNYSHIIEVDYNSKQLFDNISFKK